MDLLQATFTAYNTMRVEKKYTIYEIEVRSASTVSWIVYKRYSDFFVVHNELLKNLPKSLQLPVVPAKRFAYSLASEFVERRKQELQTYLTELLRIPQVARSEVILRFLEVPDSVRPLITRVPIANDQEKDNIESASSPKKNFNKDERKIYDLVQQLDTSLSSKVVAIRSFEKFFFEQKPKISNELIQALFFGIDGYVGLIESCGNFDYSNVAAKASLELLNRLLSIERNRDALVFQDVFLRADPKWYIKLRLQRHIYMDDITAAFEIASLITERQFSVSIDKLIPDPSIRKDYMRWLQRKQRIQSISFIDTKENFLTSPTLPDVELKALAYSAFDEIIKISESDQGWRFVSDESGAAIQIVHKKTQTDSVIIRVGLAIAHPASEVFDLLMALHHRKRWDLKFLNGKVVRSLSENMDIIYESYKSFSSPFKYRDFCHLRAWRKESDGGYTIAQRSIVHPEVPEYKDHVRASTNPSGFIISPYTIEDEKGNLVSSSLLIWVAQLDREGILIYSPDLLGETEELMKSFHNLRVELNNLKSDPESRENSSYRKSANSVTDPTPTLVEKSKSLQNKRSTIMVERRSKALPLTPSNS